MMDTDLAVYRDQEGVDVTAVTKLKHADLWRAAKAMGGQSALARHLGIKASELGEWANLKSCPPAEPVGRRWTEEYLMTMEGKLLELTGKTWEELFPQELRENAAFLGASKTIEKTARVRADAMEKYALSTRERFERLSSPAVVDVHEELRDVFTSLLETLSNREQEVVKLRYGIDQPDGAMTLRDVATRLSLSPERIRQIEAKAIRKLQMPNIAGQLVEFTGDAG